MLPYLIEPHKKESQRLGTKQNQTRTKISKVPIWTPHQRAKGHISRGAVAKPAGSWHSGIHQCQPIMQGTLPHVIGGTGCEWEAGTKLFVGWEGL